FHVGDFLGKIRSMARLVNRLSPLKVARATVPGLYGDGNNLYLQIAPSGAKSWSFRFMLRGKAREMGLGPVAVIPLAEARMRALEARRLLLEGIDPIEQRRAVREAKIVRGKSFADCAEAYIEAHRAGWSNAKHAGQWRATLSTYAYPVLGQTPVAAIDLDLVIRALKPIWTAKPETASRLRGRIEAVLDYATTKGWRQGDNPARWKGLLENVLPAKGRIARVAHHAALRWRDLPGFMGELMTQDGLAAQALALTILTAVRTGDAIGATWKEIDLGARIWTIPDWRVKGRKAEHRVPLADPVVAILTRARQGAVSPAPSAFVFPGGRAGTALSNMAMLALLRRMGRDDITTHGFRSTFRDWAAEATDYPHEVVETALAHTVNDKVVAAYRRTDFFDRRRHLMEEWAVYACSTWGTVTLRWPG
ncbi:tyrosine-type recombinase/integrase, partial [Acidiphilium sp.]|uniref:tyrosine-type recombinase/integrase n=1 Tax=Acidiphilium sp. TaxID=527 RepID=UPI003CFC9B66